MRSPRRRSVIQQTFTLCLLCISTLLGTEDREMRQAGISSLQGLTLREKKKGSMYTHKCRHMEERCVWDRVSRRGARAPYCVCEIPLSYWRTFMKGTWVIKLEWVGMGLTYTCIIVNPGCFVMDPADVFMIQESPSFMTRIIACKSTANSNKTSWRYEFCPNANFTP